MCLLKYILSHQKLCPICRKDFSALPIKELSVNRVLDDLSHRLSPTVSGFTG